MLSLSKLNDTADGILLFENEIAQLLCKQTRGILHPTLTDINDLIVSHLTAVLLPKMHKNAHITKISNLSDDLRHLCENPKYKFTDIKTIPQTSISSIQYTYDTWHALFNALSMMQRKGNWIDRRLTSTFQTPYIKSSTHFSTPNLSSASQRIPPYQHNLSLMQESDHSCHHSNTAQDSSSSFSSSSSSSSSVIKSIASVLTMHGNDAHDAIDKVKLINETTDGCSTDTNEDNAKSKVRIKEGSHKSPLVDSRNPHPFYYYTVPHEHEVRSVFAGSPLQLNSTGFKLNGYQRSLSLLSNSNAIIPNLQRFSEKATDLFQRQAYVHQYAMYGVDHHDFVAAFRNVGQIVADYSTI
jgi:hypothetical protein